MKSYRIVSGILVMLPLSLLVDHIMFQPGYAEAALREMAFMIFGAPILVLNVWAWTSPEIIEFYFLGREVEVV